MCAVMAFIRCLSRAKVMLKRFGSLVVWQRLDSSKLAGETLFGGELEPGESCFSGSSHPAKVLVLDTYRRTISEHLTLQR